MSGWDGSVRWPHLWFHRCATCGAVTLPFALRWLDPTWLWHVAGRRVSLWWRNLRNRWEDR